MGAQEERSSGTRRPCILIYLFCREAGNARIELWGSTDTSMSRDNRTVVSNMWICSRACTHGVLPISFHL